MEHKLVLNFFGKNPSILKKFLLINFIIFSIIGLFTVFYLIAIEPNLVKKKTSKHIQIINNTIPIIVSKINCHQPVLLMSCNLLHATAIVGRAVITENTKFIGP